MDNFLLNLVSGNNNPSKGERIFVSLSQIRYENGEPVVDSRIIKKLYIKIENNISGEEGYSVTILNPHPHKIFGEESIVMSTKPMRIIYNRVSEVELRGFGYDSLNDSPFSDYGLTLYLENNKPKTIVIHEFSKNKDIEHYLQQRETI